MTQRPAGLEGCNRASQEGHQDAQCHRHIHADATIPQRAEGSAEVGPRRKEHHRQRQHPTGPVQQSGRIRADGILPADVERGRIHHDLHHAKGRDEQPPDRLAGFLSRQSDCLGARIREGAIAGVLDRGDQIRRLHLLRVPGHHRALSGAGNLGTTHAGHLGQRRLDDAGAGGTMHAADQQPGLP